MLLLEKKKKWLCPFLLRKALLVPSIRLGRFIMNPGRPGRKMVASGRRRVKLRAAFKRPGKKVFPLPSEIRSHSTNITTLLSNMIKTFLLQRSHTDDNPYVYLRFLLWMDKLCGWKVTQLTNNQDRTFSCQNICLHTFFLPLITKWQTRLCGYWVSYKIMGGESKYESSFVFAPSFCPCYKNTSMKKFVCVLWLDVSKKDS